MFGLKDVHINSIQSVFKKNSKILKVLLYGSRAKSSYKNGSDIDLTLIGSELDLSTLLKIENELDDLLLPYKIDLSVFHKIENPDLIKHIKLNGIVFYKKK